MAGKRGRIVSLQGEWGRNGKGNESGLHLKGLLDEHSLVKVLKVAGQILHILVNSLKEEVKPVEQGQGVVFEFLVPFQQFLKWAAKSPRGNGGVVGWAGEERTRGEK